MGFFDKIKQGLSKTREAISETFNDIFSVSELDDDFYDELEESLILADLGMETAGKATQRLKKEVSARHIRTAAEARQVLQEILVDMLNVGSPELNLKTLPSVILVIGVNGVGKTTTIGKSPSSRCSRARRCCWWPPIPSGLPPPTSWKSGPSAAEPPSSASMRGPTRLPWSTTASSPPRPRMWT